MIDPNKTPFENALLQGKAIADVFESQDTRDTKYGDPKTHRVTVTFGITIPGDREPTMADIRKALRLLANEHPQKLEDHVTITPNVGIEE